MTCSKPPSRSVCSALHAAQVGVHQIAWAPKATLTIRGRGAGSADDGREAGERGRRLGRSPRRFDGGREKDHGVAAECNGRRRAVRYRRREQFEPPALSLPGRSVPAQPAVPRNLGVQCAPPRACAPEPRSKIRMVILPARGGGRAVRLSVVSSHRSPSLLPQT